MSVMAYLICRTCKKRTCLGKWLREKCDGQKVGFGFWRGGTTEEHLGMKALNFLAQHTDHDVLILSDAAYDKLSFTEPVGDYEDVEDQLRIDWPSRAK